MVAQGATVLFQLIKMLKLLQMHPSNLFVATMAGDCSYLHLREHLSQEIQLADTL